MKSTTLTTIATCALLASCSTESPTYIVDIPLASDMKSILITMPDTLTSVNCERAAEIAAKFFNGRYPESRAECRTISDIKTINDADGKELMYIINFADNKGFAIISAEKGYYPILAQNDTSNFITTDTESPAYFWLMSQKDIVANCAELPDSIKADIAKAWTAYDPQTTLMPDSRSNYPEKPQVYYDSLKMWSLNSKYQVYLFNDFIRTSEYQTMTEDQKNQLSTNLLMLGNSNYGTIEDVTVALVRDYTKSDFHPRQLITTTWGQDYPYNGAELYGRLLGCTTIAAGQIMKYHKWPTYYNWADMPDKGATESTQNFLYDLALCIGVDFGYGSSPATLSQVKTALEAKKYSVTYQNHNINAVKNQIDLHRPVLMSGVKSGESVGHTWVCDGIDYHQNYHEIRIMTLDYRPVAEIIPTEMIEAMKIVTDRYNSGYHYHMNWGWEGYNDGYFSDNNLGNTGNYNTNRLDLLISPNK